MPRRIVRADQVGIPVGGASVRPEFGFEFAWVASSARNSLTGPRISASTAALTGLHVGLAAGSGYVTVSANVPCLFSTTWTEVGLIYIDGASSITALSVRGTGQAVNWTGGNANCVMWNVADVNISTPVTNTPGWYSYAVRRSGSDHRVYINGRFVGSGSNASSPAANTGILPAIGAHAGSGAEMGSSAISGTRRVAMVARTSRALPDALCIAISANPGLIFEPQRRTFPIASGVTVYRPASDIVVNSWTPSTGSDLYAMIDEPTLNRADYITSPNLTNPATMGWSAPMAAGTYDVSVDFDRTGTQGQLRIVLLDSGGTAVGTSSWQAAPSSAATTVFSVTTTGTSDRFRIEVQP